MSEIPFFKHDLGKEEIDAIQIVFNSSILTTGKTVAQFERDFADFLGVNHAVGLTSCTGALHLSLIALGIGKGDEVITTSMTFIATVTAIIQAGATPVLVDSEEQTGNINIESIEDAITAKTKAIIPVHLYGQMCDMKAIRKIADKYGLKVIEDAAHCIEGSRDGIRPGHLSDTACFSFYATKNITCGEGGAVVCNSPDLERHLKLLRSHGMDKTASDREKNGYSHWDMPVFGWKYNMDNIQAALLLPQLKRVYLNLEKREALVSLYRSHLSEVKGVQLFAQQEGVVHANHLMPILVPVGLRDKLIAFLSSKAIGCVVNYRPIHAFKYFKDNFIYKVGDFPASESIGERTISLPLYPNMHVESVGVVISAVKLFLAESDSYSSCKV